MASAKRIFLINQYFYPDMAATSQLLGDLAQWLGSNGWEVVAIAGRGSYANAGKVNGSGTERICGNVVVQRVWCTNFGRGHLLARLCDYATFLISAGAAVAFSSSPDVVLCLSTPPFVGALGLIAQAKGSRLVYKVEDLYPDVAIALSTLDQKSLSARFFSWLSGFLLKKADWIVTLDNAMAERVRHQTAATRSLETIPNWADGDAIWPNPDAGRIFRKRQKLEGRFVVLYSGNLGLPHRFDAVVEAARRCATEFPEVLFLFVGNGARLNEVRETTKDIANVRFLDYQPREELSELYNAADVHLVTLRNEVAGMLFPSKYAAALAAGKPVLLVGGQGAPFEREIQERLLGWTCPHDPSAVLAAIQDALKNPDKREAMGRNARQVFDACYSKMIAMQRWEQVLNSVLRGKTIGAHVQVNAGEPAGLPQQ
jgi:glycosyltransferase involved in cell wall biosynthesis